VGTGDRRSPGFRRLASRDPAPSGAPSRERAACSAERSTGSGPARGEYPNNGWRRVTDGPPNETTPEGTVDAPV